MKFSTAIFFTTVAAAFARKPTKSIELPSALDSQSSLGKKVLSSARRLEDADAEVDYSWVADYSIKFQGCHHVKQWNVEADEGEDVRIATKRLVRFRLCPSDTCDGETAGGCTSGYGDYIVDMDTYLQAYVENLEQVQEWTCENLQENVCGCDDDDNKDDGFDEEQCLNNCYANNGADFCVEEEQDDAAGEPFELADYVMCAQVDFGERRRLEEEAQYFVGPYCSDQGSEVVLGLFTDDACSVFADSYGGRSTYSNLAGENLPYSEESILGLECQSCMEPEDPNNDADQADEDLTTEMCEQMYTFAGKCESNGMGDGNSNACNYMDGIKIMRSNGVISSPSGSSSAATMIGLFAASFFVVGAYAYYLKTKLDKIVIAS